MGVFRTDASLLYTVVYEIVVAKWTARVRDHSSHWWGEIENARWGAQAISQQCTWSIDKSSGSTKCSTWRN